MHRPPQISRRRLIQLAGASVAVSVTAAALQPGFSITGLVMSTARGGRKDVRLGVILPKSQVYPEMGRSIMNGLSMALGQSGDVRAGMEVEEVQGGQSAARQAARRLAERDVDVVVASVSNPVVREVGGVLSERQIPLLASNIGANVVRVDERDPLTAHAPLNFWQSAWSAGVWGVGEHGPRVVLSTSMADSGYDSVYAFRSGVEYAGGQVVETVVSDVRGPHDFMATMDAIAAARPDFVFGLHSGKAAGEFMSAYTGSRVSEDFPLVGSAFLADGSAGSGPQAEIAVAQIWADSLPGQANDGFRSEYEVAYGHAPSVFAVMGFESGQRIVKATREIGGDFSSAGRVAEALRGVEVEGPRGAVRFIDDRWAAESGSYLSSASISAGGAGQQVIAPLDRVPENEELVARLHRGVRSGWLNEYLCA